MSQSLSVKGYPVFLIGLENRRCIVVGSGREAERKVEGLLESDAQVTVIGAHVTDRLRQWVDAGRVQWIGRDYQPGDLQDAYLIIVGNSNPAVIAQIWEEATSIGALVNVMDDIPHCTFIAGSVMRQGPLTIAISTNGCAPALAVRLKEQMQEQFGPEYAAFLALMRDLREPLAERYPNFKQRRDLWYALVDSDILDLLRAGEAARASERVAEIVGIDVLNPHASGDAR